MVVHALGHSICTGIFQLSGQAPLHFGARSQLSRSRQWSISASRLVFDGSLSVLLVTEMSIAMLFFHDVDPHLTSTCVFMFFCGGGWLIPSAISHFAM